MRHTYIWPDDVVATDLIDKPKHIRCLEEELAPLNIIPRPKRGTAPTARRVCSACGDVTRNVDSLCSRSWCRRERGVV